MLDGETLVKVIKPPIVHIDISGIMLGTMTERTYNGSFGR